MLQAGIRSAAGHRACPLLGRRRRDLAIWILLDGGWQVEAGGEAYSALHAEAGKWHGGAAVQGAPLASRLVASQHSDVLRISAAAFARMRQQGAGFDTHRRQGMACQGEILRPAG